MSLVIFVMGGLILGLACARSLHRSRFMPEGERGLASALHDTTSTLLFAFAVWIGTSWILALAHAFSFWPLTIAGIVELGAGGIWLYRSGFLRARESIEIERWFAIAALVAIAPILVWVIFVFWRGTILPVYNQDALAYHLPKAVLLMKAHAFGGFDVPEARVATWPCSYELLLASTMILSGSDHFTAAVDTLAYVGILIATAQVAARLWGNGVHVFVSTAVVAAIPIMILHSGIHKNDLLEDFFALVLFAYAARWFAIGSVASLVEATMALLLSIGTKVNGAMFLVAVLPVIALGALRHRSRVTPARAIAFVVGAGILSLVFGAVPYLFNIVTIHKIVAPPEMTGGGGYGDWSNLWTFTVMLFLHPFGKQANFVWNPFDRAYFWWPTNDVWMSHFGAVVSILAFLLVPCVIRYRRREDARERNALHFATFVAYALTLPIHMHPRGLFGLFGRYVLFVAPVIVVMTLSPIMIELRERLRKNARYVELALSAACALAFVRAAVTFGLHDNYAPFGWIAHVLEHPEDRVPYVRRNRAESVFDHVVPETEACALDVGYDTWIYPAYGEHWTRDVRFLPRVAGAVPIPSDVDWVLVDRSWNVFFGHPAFTDTSKVEYLGNGRPSREDLKVYRQLSADPRFELVYEDKPQLQAIFHRRANVTPNAP